MPPPAVEVLTKIQEILADVLGLAAPRPGAFNDVKVVTTAGVPEALPEQKCTEVFIQAKRANTGIIYIGDSSVSSTTAPALLAGDGIVLPVANTNQLWIDASVSGEGVFLLGVI